MVDESHAIILSIEMNSLQRTLQYKPHPLNHVDTVLLSQYVCVANYYKVSSLAGPKVRPLLLVIDLIYTDSTTNRASMFVT